MSGASLLLVEDRASLRKMLERALALEGYDVEAVGDAPDGVAKLGERPFDLVVTDLKLPTGSGLDVVAAAAATRPATPVVVLTAYGSVRTAVEAMRLGAADFIEKPVEIDDLVALLRGLRDEGASGEEEAFEVPGGPTLVGRHPRFRAALKLLRKVAPTGSTVLLTGESGTGKELFARAIHALSPWRDGPFVAVNCAAIPETLIENELFGHEKGAFTGADRRQAGLFEQARGGTILLDEIGELGLGVQAKVLRVLEERTFERIGGRRTLEADVRLVAATNRDLATMVEGGEFRSDLFFRLDVFPIELPPLRERPEDVSLLARHLLAEIAARHGVERPRLAAEATELLAGQPWPGNVRQLANVLERAVILDEGGGAIDRAALVPLLPGAGPRDEREAVRDALVAADGDKRRAAEILGVSYRTLLRRVKAYDLEGVPRYRS